MCAVTIALAATGLGMSLAGTGLSAYGQIQQGHYQKKMANYQADVETMRAAEANEQAGPEIMEQAARRKQQLGIARTASAQAGSMLDSSPLDASQVWEQDQAYMGVYDAEKIRRDAELQSWGFLSSADAGRAQGRMASWSGNMGAVGSVVGGVRQAGAYGAQAYSSHRTNQRLDALEN